jgi:hypothetical protein
MTPERILCAVAAILIAGTGAEFPQQAAASDVGGTVSLQTVPALAGVRLAVGGSDVTTDAGGGAALWVPDLDGIAGRVSLATARLDPTTTVALSKVHPLPHTIARRSNLMIGLDVTSAVRLRVQPGTTGVPPTSIQLLRLHSIAGQVLDVNPVRTRRVRLLSRRTRLTNGVLTTQDVTWSVDRAAGAPGLALTTAGPRFDPFGHRRWAVRLQPVRGTIEIGTVPATAGVTFALGGATVTTGRDGSARVPVSDLNDVQQRLQLGSTAAGPVTVSLLRVSKLPPGAPHRRRLVAALEVRRDVTLRFVSPLGESVPAGHVQEVDLSGGGPMITLTGRQVRDPVSLPEAIASEVAGHWRTRSLRWSVSGVRFDGGEAVFAGKQRYSPNPAGTWKVVLSVFRVRVAVRDALFGSRVGSSVWVTRADGTGFPLRVGSAAPGVVPAMVRGLYDLRVDAAVFGKHTKVLVSRDDLVDVRVITPLDVAMIALSLALVGAGALMIGRAASRKRSRHQRGVSE